MYLGSRDSNDAGIHSSQVSIHPLASQGNSIGSETEGAVLGKNGENAEHVK